MKTTRLNFADLEENLEVIDKTSLWKITGGTDPEIQWGLDGNGYAYYRYGEEGQWILATLNEVEVVYRPQPMSLFSWQGIGDGMGGSGSFEDFYFLLYGGGSGAGNTAPPLDINRVNFVGGYVETFSITNHLDAYNFLDGMQNGTSSPENLLALVGLSNITTAAHSLVSFVMSIQNGAWGGIETLYMNTGNAQGIIIEKVVMSGQHTPVPNVTYRITTSSGGTLGSVYTQGW